MTYTPTFNAVAANVTFDPAGLSNLTATNVQEALEQIDAALDTIVSGGIADGDKGDIIVSSGGSVWTVDIDTNDVPEGASNKYYTDERVDDRVSSLLVAGSNITLTYNDVANTLTIASTGGGGGGGNSYFPNGW